MTQRDMLLDRLADADPARALRADATERAATWARIEAEGAAAPARRPRLRKRSLAFAIAAALPAVAAVAAVVSLVHPGSADKRSQHGPDQHRGNGAILPKSVRVLDVSTPDPAGGPPWGMRVYSTTRGVGCMQIGRLADGKLGVLGRDGAFNDDGRFHPLGADSSLTRGDCAPLDGANRLFLTAAVDYIAASGTHSCYLARFFRGGPPPGPSCRASSLRSVYFGTLGPEAKSVTYRAGGQLRTLPTRGPEGAYLIVVRAKMQSRSDSTQVGLLPLGSPIRSIHYRHGRVCHLPVRGRPRPGHSCVPEGYVPAKADGIRAEDVTAPVRARVVHTHNNRQSIVVTFTARAPVTDARSVYTVTFARGTPPGDFYGLMTQGDVRAGQTITKRLTLRKRGTYRVTVRFVHERGPVIGAVPRLPDDGLLVGRATIRVSG
jgi:hypothetical protein